MRALVGLVVGFLLFAFGVPLLQWLVRLTGWFDEVADHLGPADGKAFTPLRAPSPQSLKLARSALDASNENLACTLWVEQHLGHIVPYLDGLARPADLIAQRRRTRWWH